MFELEAMGDNNSPPSAPPPPSAGTLTYPYSLNFQSSTSVAIIIVVLGATFFFMFLFVIYIKRCNVERMEHESLTGATTGGWNRQHHSMIHGLDPEILKKFPIMKYSSVVSTTKPKDTIECAVCLGVFEESELLRVLPACGHLFHPDCIDMWLQTHSTCPLCRRSLSRDAVSGHLQRALAAITGSIWNSSSTASPEQSTHPDNNLDVEAGTEPSSGPSNDATNSNTGQILRALSRNSESFKRAAHHLEVQDVRERIRAAASSSSGRFGSPSLNSSASGRFQRINSRNQIDQGMMLTPLSCGVMQHSQSFNELSRQVEASPNLHESGTVSAHCPEGEVHSERLKSIPRTMSFSSIEITALFEEDSVSMISSGSI